MVYYKNLKYLEHRLRHHLVTYSDSKKRTTDWKRTSSPAPAPPDVNNPYCFTFYKHTNLDFRLELRLTFKVITSKHFLM